MAIDEILRRGVNAHRPPIGATGAIWNTRLWHAMPRDGLQIGCETLCTGGKPAAALALERTWPMRTGPVAQGLDPCAAPRSRLAARESTWPRAAGEPRCD